ncbi:hypothetical protein AA0120_g6212 [Alternaria tenuissima]|nr:hypothetical protein AA0120_g6212 [Alternaria tenuissima]
MANIGKLSGALVSGVNENTLALANLNFNFAVFKVEPPQEFQGLGNSLSRLRRDKAETGSSHYTARKLGALFEQLVPRMDQLLKAYGTRVSEISLSSEGKTKRSFSKNVATEGAFQHHTGIDGTTIWAAATSGKSAIGMNLLACMLAKIWDPDEATAIWVHLVKSHRKEIELNCDGSEPSHIAPLAAAAEDISLKELQEWDASARAWLDIARSAKTKQYKQLEIIYQNVPVPVDGDPRAYSSVMRAWRTAVTTTENLLKGMPQKVQSGAILLALLSWNIYPDMDVFVTTGPKSIVQKDELVPQGGRLTVGLEKGNEDMPDGVHWSLYLEDLRYYGDPVLRQRSAGSDTARVTFDEFAVAALGSFFSGWPIVRSELDVATTLTVSIWDNLAQSCQAADLKTEDMYKITQFVTRKPNWLHSLATIATNVLEERGRGDTNTLKLLETGFRKGGSFLGKKEHRLAPAFGLLDPGKTLAILKSNAEKIRLLRRVAKDRGINAPKAVIRYLNPESGNFEYTTVFPRFRKPLEVASDTRDRLPLHALWIPQQEEADDKSRLGCRCNQGCSRRCSCKKRGSNCTSRCHAASSLPCNNISDLVKEPTMPLFSANEDEVTLFYTPEDIFSDQKTGHEGEGFSWFNAPTRLESSSNTDDMETIFLPGRIRFPQNDLTPKVEPVTPVQETIDEEDGLEEIFDLDKALSDFDKAKSSRTIRFNFAFGDADSCAVFLSSQQDEDAMDTNQLSYDLSIHELMEVLASGDVHGLKLLDHLQYRWTMDLPGITDRSRLKTETEYTEVDKQMPGTYICSLKALGSVVEIYKLLTGTSVALRVIGRTLGTSNWVNKAAEKDMRTPRSHQDCFQAFEPDRPSTFSCIAMFDTGNLDLDPSLLAQVMALASRNAIYTSSSLLCDPSDDIRGYEIKCLVGNVGRAGIALMIPPTEPRILKDDIGHYKVINHQPYDGQNRNSLGGSSLHLSFTGYEQTVVEALSHHGAQMSEVFFLESLISAYDRTKWIADLDVLASFDDGSLARAPLPSNQLSQAKRCRKPCY